MVKKRQDEIAGMTYSAKTTYGRFFVTINKQDGEPFEVIPRLGKPGNMVRTLLENIGIQASILLRTSFIDDDGKDISLERKKAIFEDHFRGVRDDNPFMYKQN